MKRLYLVILYTIGIFFISCSSDNDNSSEIPEIKRKYIKSVNQLDAPDPDRDELFEYNQGFIIRVKTYNTLNGSYQYDSEGKLISKSFGRELYTYQYDDQNRMIRENKVGTNDYIELTYEPGKVTTKQFSELRNGEGDIIGDVLGTREFQIDVQGRIIKMREISILANTEFGEDERRNVEYAKYEYDAKGNIIKRISKLYGDSNESITNLNYDDKINPYYIAFEKYYESAYYIEFFTGLRLTSSTYGLTPNNIINYTVINIINNTVIEYDEDNYPKSWQRFYGNGEAYDAEQIFEYFE